MSFDIKKLGQNFAASFSPDGLGLQLGNMVQNQLFSGLGSQMNNQGLGLGFPMGNSQTQMAAQQNMMQQMFAFTLNLVKVVLEFAKGTQGATPAAASAESAQQTSAEQGAAAPATQATETPASATATPATSETKDFATQLKDAASQLEKQMASLEGSLSKFIEGGATLTKRSKSGLKSLFSRGLKLGEQFAKYSKLLGF